MKKTFSLFACLLISIKLLAQAPQKMSYQAVIRNASNNLVASTPVKLKISILQGSASGTAVYSEQHNPTTNANGLVTIEIGSGTSPIGTFSSINWGNGTYFLKTETDPNNGSTYSIVGTSQLLSVPYSLFSDCVSSSIDGDTLFIGCKKYVIPGIANTGISDHTCGATNIHNSSAPYGSMTDQDGYSYRTIRIGNQVWMAENLRTTKYRNGVNIQNIKDNSQWLNDKTGAFCSYNNLLNDCPNGKLYNWYAVNNTNQLCPKGWHVPTDVEWNILIQKLDPSFNPTASGVQSTIAGGNLKSTGIQYWTSPNTSSNNISGFSGIPGGARYDNAFFYDSSNIGYWWTSTETDNNNNAWSRLLFFNNSDVSRRIATKISGFSVRCIKD